MTGTGSVYRRRKDGRWVAAVSTGPRGNRTTIVRYAPKRDNTKRAASALLDDLRSLVQPTAGTGRTTVGQYLRSWLDTAGRRSLKASTWRTYDAHFRLHIEPAIGHVVLAKLTAEHVDTMLAGLGLEPKGQRNVLGFLGRVLAVAMDRGHVLRNAARLVEPPRAVHAEPATLTPEQARAIIAAVRGDRLEALWLAALGTGLRQGELLGLRWSDVDLLAAQLTVTYALTRAHGQYVLDDPKTARSKRPVALPAFVVTALKEHRIRQLAERLAAGVETKEGLVFVAPTGMPLNQGWVSHRWRIISRGVGVDVNFHGMRHSNATIMRDMGVPEDVRMSRMGHTTVKVHRQYAHATESPDRAAAKALDEALG